MVVPASPTPSKPALRRSLLKTRQSMPEQEWRDRSDRLCAHLQTLPAFQQAQTILVYFSTRNEPDLSSLFRLQKTWGLPRCVGQALSWHCWSPIEPLQPGAFGIAEPLATAPVLEAAQVDLILVPAIACDESGYRLGYGGGFYDRLLSQPEWATKPTIGIVFAFAHLPSLPHDSWDQPLQGICTEEGWREFS